MQIRNWKRHQHFKDRKPPWIKLYRDLLDDMDWYDLSGDASKLLVMLWLIGSENDGYLPDIKLISFRIRKGISEVAALLRELTAWIDGVDEAIEKISTKTITYSDDITVISNRYQSDSVETETETYKPEKEKPLSDSVESNRAKPEVVNELFEEFWTAFAYKSGKAEALKSWNKIKPSRELATRIIEGAKREADIRPALYAAGGTPKMAQGWLSGRRWEDEQKLIPLNRSQQRTVQQEMASGSFVDDIMMEAQNEIR